MNLLDLWASVCQVAGSARTRIDETIHRASRPDVQRDNLPVGGLNALRPTLTDGLPLRPIVTLEAYNTFRLFAQPNMEIGNGLCVSPDMPRKPLSLSRSITHSDPRTKGKLDPVCHQQVIEDSLTGSVRELEEACSHTDPAPGSGSGRISKRSLGTDKRMAAQSQISRYGCNAMPAGSASSQFASLVRGDAALDSGTL